MTNPIIQKSDRPVCSVDGCEKPRKARGWCLMHWARWRRHGDPLYARVYARRECTINGCDSLINSRGLCRNHAYRLIKYGDPLLGNRGTSRGAPMQWIKDHADYSGSGCIEWPFAMGHNGYGTVKYEGRARIASRIMCIIAHGNPVDDRLQAAHSCGNGHLACMNPKHLAWKTNEENVQDARKHGTWAHGEQVPQSKLTEQQAREIAALKGKVRQKDLAKKYAVGVGAIAHIHCSATWVWTGAKIKAKSEFIYGEGHHNAKITEDDVKDIRRLSSTMTREAIGYRFGINKDHVGRIQRRVYWKHVK